MNTHMLELTCRDAIVSRDGRPFGAGQGLRMRSHRWPLPSVVAGSCRTVLGKLSRNDFSEQTAKELLQIGVAGFFPAVNHSLFLPAPSDCLLHPDRRIFRMKPKEIQEGSCDWPAIGLQPVMLSDETVDDFKPAPLPEWWPVEKYALWLSNPSEFSGLDDSFLQNSEPEERFHGHLNPESGTVAEGELFMSSALPLSRLRCFGKKEWADIQLSVRVQATEWAQQTIETLDTLHPLGGERRLVHWKTVSREKLWKCPAGISTALNQAKNIRMVLATPAIFQNGWKPGWLDDRLEGTPPGTTTKLKLIGVNIYRWQAISGWSLAEPRGPKAVRRMVPAGGAYFFQLQSGESSILKDRWLESVCDEEQDRRDGFGLATWGRW